MRINHLVKSLQKSHCWRGIVAGVLAGSITHASDVTWDEGCEKIGLSAGGSIFQGNCSPHDPKLLTVATDMDGAFITYDAGLKWNTIHFSQLAGSHCAAAAFHPSNPDVIYWINRGCELKVSRDKGFSWAHVGAEQPWGSAVVVRIWLDPDCPERIFVGTETDTYLSRDSGSTWSKCGGISGYLFRVVVDRKSPAQSRVYWIGTSAGIYRSDDDGRTFMKKMQGIAGQTLSGFAGGSNEKCTILYASVPCEAKDGKLVGGMFRSKNRGETWECCMNPRINVSTKRSSEYASDLPTYGWIACADKQPERAYVFCRGTSFFPPNHTTIYRTDNAGDAWQPVFFSDPRFKKSDKRLGDSAAECNVETDWQTECWGQREQGEVRGLEINPSNPDMVVLTQSRFIHATMDAGRTWHSPYAGTRQVDGQGRKQWANSGEVVTSSWNYTIDPFDKLNRFICYTDIGLARSVDGGKTWMPLQFDLEKVIPRKWANSCYALAFDPGVTGRVWGAFSAMHDIPNEFIFRRKGISSGGVAVSDDHGATWRKVNLPVDGSAMSIAIDPSSPQDKRTLYVSMFERGIIHSTDNGASWAMMTNGLDPEGSKRSLNLVLHKDGTLFVATTAKNKKSTVGVGLYRSMDKGETWTNIAPAKKWAWIRDFTVNPDDSQTILVPTSLLDPGLHRTTDGGKTWQTIYQANGQYHFYGAYYHPTHKGWIYLTCGESGEQGACGIHLSKDDGKTWAPFPKIPFQSIQRVSFDAGDPGHIYLTTFGSSVLRVAEEP